MAIQKDVNLNEPLSDKVPPTLGKTSLTPELSQAALILHGDYYSQLQGRCNRYVFWHTFSTTFLIISTSIFTYYRLYDYISVSESIGEFFSFFSKSRDFQFQVMGVLPWLVCIFGIVGIVAHFVSDVFKDISVKLPQLKYMEKIFGFNLREYAKLSQSALLKQKRNLTSKDTVFLKNGENTHLVIYRDSPIAIITLKPLLDESSESNFVIKITGLHVRKAFAKVDFDVLLLEWSYERARELLKEYKPSKNAKITLLADAFSFDKQLIKTLENQSFQKISSSFTLNSFEDDSGSQPGFFSYVTSTGAYKAFGISKDTYRLTLQDKTADIIQ